MARPGSFPPLGEKHQKGVQYTATGLPPGMSCDPETGQITPTTPGHYTATVTQTAVLAWPWSWLRKLRLA